MHLLHLQVVHPLRRGGPLARERRAAGVGQDLLAYGQLAGQAPVLGGGGVDGVAGGDAQGVATVKFQGPNVIGLVYKDTGYRAKNKAFASIFVYWALLGVGSLGRSPFPIRVSSCHSWLLVLHRVTAAQLLLVSL